MVKVPAAKGGTRWGKGSKTPVASSGLTPGVYFLLIQNPLQVRRISMAIVFHTWSETQAAWVLWLRRFNSRLPCRKEGSKGAAMTKGLISAPVWKWHLQHRLKPTCHNCLKAEKYRLGRRGELGYGGHQRNLSHIPWYK